ncbi:hypothetical protein ACJX0J_019824, partial [Zea mays]
PRPRLHSDHNCKRDHLITEGSAAASAAVAAAAGGDQEEAEAADGGGVEAAEVCSAGIARDKSPMELSFQAMGFVVEQDFKAFSPVVKNKTMPVEEAVDPNQVSNQSFRFSEKGSPPSTSGKVHRSVSKEVETGKARRSASGKAGPSKNKWMDLFPSIVSNARTIQVISHGATSVHMGSGSLILEVSDNNCVYPNEVHHTARERTQVLQDVSSDPNLPRTKTVRRNLYGHAETVFFQHCPCHCFQADYIL